MAPCICVCLSGVVGALIWSLRSRSFKGGGFYWHSEPFGNSIYCSYHWPGFPSGERYDEVRSNRGIVSHRSGAHRSISVYVCVCVCVLSFCRSG